MRTKDTALIEQIKRVLKKPMKKTDARLLYGKSQERSGAVTARYPAISKRWWSGG